MQGQNTRKECKEKMDERKTGRMNGRNKGRKECKEGMQGRNARKECKEGTQGRNARKERKEGKDERKNGRRMYGRNKGPRVRCYWFLPLLSVPLYQTLAVVPPKRVGVWIEGRKKGWKE
jgi:hypothetical protein